MQPLVQTGEPGSEGQGVIDVDGAVLTDPVDAIGGLVLPGGVPVAGEVDDVVGLDDGQADPCRQGRQDQGGEPLGASEALQDLAPRAGSAPCGGSRNLAVDHAHRDPELALDQGDNQALQVPILHEYQGLLALLADLAELLQQPADLA